MDDAVRTYRTVVHEGDRLVFESWVQMTAVKPWDHENTKFMDREAANVVASALGRFAKE